MPSLELDPASTALQPGGHSFDADALATEVRALLGYGRMTPAIEELGLRLRPSSEPSFGLPGAQRGYGRSTRPGASGRFASSLVVGR
jgi:hypothetical protein